ncbi:MAG TPA: hypothetical protein PLA43_04835 [Bryobacteraceae bacterium]|nr:hypothetical protein [Bryobacteraceae bacterium]HOQ45187.1 hypothetical protein [Bryobacteraceae bacterium]HPU71259.1 hypothetical protein [Bryobacteraceae bacterium]
MRVEEISLQKKRELVARVANSSYFQKSPRLRSFFLYVAECTLENRLEDVREVQIAQHVFHRKADYNPGQDNIVRVEARSLRKRLELFFANEGKDETMIISMPKGSYALTFEPRSQQQQLEAPPEEVPAATQAGSSPWRVRVLWLAVAVLACALVLQGYLYRQGGASEPGARRTLPFSALLDNTRDTYIVTSDTALIVIQELAGQQLTLDEYINRRYPEPTDRARLELARRMQTRQYTNAAEVRIATRIMSFQGDPSRPVLLRYAREMQLSDFKDHNVILLGSPIANPWASLLGKSLSFQFGIDGQWRGMIRNLKPRAGEQPLYAMTTRSGESGEAYAVVALIPNVTGQGSVLLVAGTTGEGTQAAGEFICDEALASKALREIGIDPEGPLRYFEILLKVQTVAGSPSQSAVLAARTIPESS